MKKFLMLCAFCFAASVQAVTWSGEASQLPLDRLQGTQITYVAFDPTTGTPLNSFPVQTQVVQGELQVEVPDHPALSTYSQPFRLQREDYPATCQVDLQVSAPVHYFVVTTLFWSDSNKKNRMWLSSNPGEQVIWFYVDVDTSVRGTITCERSKERYQLDLVQGWNTVVAKTSVEDSKQVSMYRMPEANDHYTWFTAEQTTLDSH